MPPPRPRDACCLLLGCCLPPRPAAPTAHTPGAPGGPDAGRFVNGPRPCRHGSCLPGCCCGCSRPPLLMPLPSAAAAAAAAAAQCSSPDAGCLGPCPPFPPCASIGLLSLCYPFSSKLLLPRPHLLCAHPSHVAPPHSTHPPTQPTYPPTHPPIPAPPLAAGGPPTDLSPATSATSLESSRWVLAFFPPHHPTRPPPSHTDRSIPHIHPTPPSHMPPPHLIPPCCRATSCGGWRVRCCTWQGVHGGVCPFHDPAHCIALLPTCEPSYLAHTPYPPHPQPTHNLCRCRCRRARCPAGPPP